MVEYGVINLILSFYLTHLFKQEEKRLFGVNQYFLNKYELEIVLSIVFYSSLIYNLNIIQAVMDYCLISGLLILSKMDFFNQVVSAKIINGLKLLVFVYILLKSNRWQRMILALSLFLILKSYSILYKLIRKETAFGEADFDLFLMIGGLLRVEKWLICLLIACVLAILFNLGKKRLAFIPYLSFALIYTLYFT